MEKIYLELKKSFIPWQNINSETLIKDLDSYYKTNYKFKKIIRLEIKNNKLKYENEHLKEVYNNLFFIRSESVIKLFKLALKKINKCNIKLRNFVCYFTINDYTITKQLPIFAFAKPINTIGILIPDWTFISLENNVIKSNWDDTKDILNSNISKIKEKDNIIFFQGANTSKIIRNVREYKSDIRENLKLLSVSNDKFIIKIDEPQEPIANWIRYKYLLDLPGAYPWSVRFKELLMMKSIVIKIDVKVPWINFYSSLLIPNVDYIQIKYNYEEEPKKLALDIYEKIQKTYRYMNTNKNNANVMIDSAYKNINKLSMNGIIDYMVLLLKLTEKLLHNSNNSTNKSIKITKNYKYRNKIYTNTKKTRTKITISTKK